MATIDLQDEVFATLTQRGNIIASVRLIGVNSISNILQQLRLLVSKCVGLVTLKIRNRTQGWLQCRQIMLSLPREENSATTQLTLF